MTPLLKVIRRRIAETGPITIAEYMELALGHPRFGYYRRRDPFGKGGDFVTAPEVSQMFGELIGLWCAVVWQSMGAPRPVVLCELGPGRGTLMADALRATAGAVPAFNDAARVHLVETSPRFRARQREVLANVPAAARPRWHRDFVSVPPGPIIAVANELFDALPIRQFVRRPEGWRERVVGLDASGHGLALAERDTPPPMLPAKLAVAETGEVVETSAARIALAAEIGARVSAGGGAALIIDYGHAASAPGDTLQAVRRHAFHDVLDSPGDADLTAHVNFEALAEAASNAGAAFHGPIGQAVFLGRLGIEQRAQILAASATPQQRRDVDAALHRLLHPREMGVLFKALALSHPQLPAPPGF